MLRLAILGATIFATLVLMHSGEVHAQDDPSSLNSRDDMRGMFVLRWPFGRTETAAPRVGFDFEMQRRSDLDHLNENRDPTTGQRLPEIDAGSIRTWSLEEPEFTLPGDRHGNPDSYAGNSRTRPLEEPEIIWPDNLGQELKFMLPEDAQADPEDEEPEAEPQPSG